MSSFFFNSTAFIFNDFESIRDFLCGAFHLFQTIEHFLTVSPYGEKHKQDKDAPEYGCDKGGESGDNVALSFRHAGLLLC